MRKLDREYLFSGVVLGVVVIGLAVFAYKCSTMPRPVVTISMNLLQKPVLDYTGPGLYTEQCDVDQFVFQVDLSREVRLTKAFGLFRRGTGKRMSLFIQSTSLEPYNIRLMGFFTNQTTDIPPDQLSEIIEMPAGPCRTNLDRFLLYRRKPIEDPATIR